MQHREWVNLAARQLAQELPAEDSPRRMAELLLCKVCGCDRLSLIRSPERLLEPAHMTELEQLVARAVQHEPLAYLLGHKEFYGREFAVSPATLIPRPETEHLVEKALALLPDQGVRFVDLGTGSGCLAVTLAAERPHWQGLAVDISPQALEVARANAATWGVELFFACADMAHSAALARAAAPFFWQAHDPGNAAGQADVPESAPFALDLVVSNPPYISEAAYQGLEPNVRCFEPKLALVPGQTGLELPAAVVATAAKLLRPCGWLLMEHGFDQALACRQLCAADLWEEVQSGVDLFGHERFLVARRKNRSCAS